jgi:hypothetical protein
MNDIRGIAKQHALTVVSRVGGDQGDQKRANDLKLAFLRLNDIGGSDEVAEAVTTLQEVDYVSVLMAVSATNVTTTLYQSFMQGFTAAKSGKRILNNHFAFKSGDMHIFVMSTESSLESLCRKLVAENDPRMVDAVDAMINELHSAMKH